MSSRRSDRDREPAVAGRVPASPPWPARRPRGAAAGVRDADTADGRHSSCGRSDRGAAGAVSSAVARCAGGRRIGAAAFVRSGWRLRETARPAWGSQS